MAETLYIPSRPIVPISTEAPFFIVATTDQPCDGEDERKRFAVRRMGLEALRRERVEKAIAGLRVR
jgi:hypothetical protein